MEKDIQMSCGLFLLPEDSSKNLADVEATLPFFEEGLASSDPMAATRIFGLSCGSSIGSN